MLSLYSEALRLRRENGVFCPLTRENWEAGTMSFGVGAIRFESKNETYLLIFDLRGGHEGSLKNEPLARLVSNWEQVFSSNEERFGGGGKPAFDLPSQSCAFRDPETILLKSRE
jgi:hypothetical protein